MSIEELECDPQYALEIHNGCFSWDLDTQEVTLKHIDIQIPTGVFCCTLLKTTKPINFMSRLKMIKLRLETGLKSQASNWLKWRLISIPAKQILEICDWSPILVL
jgi:hypothetical protein